MKFLKFREELSKLILNGTKKSTWRLFDDKDLKKGDKVTFLVWENKKEFATAIITEVKEKKLSELTDKDWEGHEKFSSEKEMYETYSKYYSKTVDENTSIKIVHFKLI
jgi:hypothetical protein